MTEALERYRVYIVGALLALLLLAAVVTYVRRPASQPIEVIDASPSSRPTPQQLAVYVTGAVVEPGVWYVPDGSRVVDAVETAGGARPEADLNRINLARRVHDEEQIHVPAVGEEYSPASPESAAGGGLINVNSAGVTELGTLPGIGPALSQRIVDYRQANGPFATIEDLKAVRGIGEGLFNEIRDLITVG